MPADPTLTITTTTHDASGDAKRTLDAVVDGYCRRTSQVAGLRSKLARLVWAASAVVKAYEDGGMITPMGNLIDTLRDIDAPAPSQTEAERENERLREEVADKEAELDEASRIIMKHVNTGRATQQEIATLRAQVACEANATETIWAQKGKRDEVIAELRLRLDAQLRQNSHLHATIAELEHQAGDAADVPRLKGELAKAEAAYDLTLKQNQHLEHTIAELSAREAETAQRCEAVVKAAAEVFGHKLVIPHAPLATLRQAVDALRPATATEAQT